jgi:hypothetical protein
MDKISKEFEMSFETCTDIGFDMAEIKQNSTEDLLMLRRSIYDYLNAKNLKKRNPKYMDVYKRINKELSLRNAENKYIPIQNTKNEAKSDRSDSFSAKSLFEFFEKEKRNENKEDLLKNKTKNSSNFDFPNFLNDKINKVIEKKKENLKQSGSVEAMEKISILNLNKIKEQEKEKEILTFTSLNKFYTGLFLIKILIFFFQIIIN